MKRAIMALLVVAMAIPAFQSCKKGDNDPFISFRTRKARLVGEWTLREGKMTEIYMDGTTYNYIFDGAMQTITIDTNAPYARSYAEKVTINKDGSYQKEIQDGNEITIREGAWYFGRKNTELDIKNKETVWFTLRSQSSSTDDYTFTGTKAFNSNNVWLLDELKNKEIVVLTDGTYTIHSSTYTIKGTLTYVKK